jgi:two-component system sensor histidine kinase GlrK
VIPFELPRRYYPRSFLKLLVIGFVLVLAPLVLAFVYSALQLERLAKQGREAVDQAAEAARESRLLIEQVTAMERLARQYAILGDATMVGDYGTIRARFKTTTSALSLLPLDERQLADLNKVIDSEQRLYDRVNGQPFTLEDRAAMVQGFVDLGAAARRVLDESNALIEREVQRMSDTAADARRTLLAHLFATLPLGIGVAAVLTYLIARPIRQLDNAIRHLGEAEFGRDIVVDGPADLRYLGERLEWLRQRLAELEEQKTQFLRHVSHELKTPLTALREGTALLADGAMGPLNPPQKEIVGILTRSAAELATLIDRLLDYQRAMASLSSLELEPADLAEIASRAVDPHRLAAAARGVRIRLDTQPAPLVGDAEKLRIVVDNLVSNAIRFTPEGGTVSVSTRREGDAGVIEVQDTGPGVRAEDRDRVFDWFFKSPTAGGSGFGLAIARELAAAHGGRIDLMPPADRGARFRVLVPTTVRREARREKERV